MNPNNDKVRPTYEELLETETSKLSNEELIKRIHRLQLELDVSTKETHRRIKSLLQKASEENNKVLELQLQHSQIPETVSASFTSKDIALVFYLCGYNDAQVYEGRGGKEVVPDGEKTVNISEIISTWKGINFGEEKILLILGKMPEIWVELQKLDKVVGFTFPKPKVCGDCYQFNWCQLKDSKDCKAWRQQGDCAVLDNTKIRNCSNCGNLAFMPHYNQDKMNCCGRLDKISFNDNQCCGFWEPQK